MDAHAIFVVALTFVAFAALASERWSIESIAFAVLVVLVLAFTMVPYVDAAGQRYDPMRLLSGFGHQALVAICALMILGRGLLATGALEPAARALARLWTHRPRFAMLLLLCACALGSAFINDTPIVVVAMPILIGVAVRLKQPPSRTLMPMNFAVLLGGMGTTIGTSTNLLVVSIAAGLGVREFGMFDFAGLAALAAGVGVLYLWLVLPHLLPDRDGAVGDASPQVFEAELHVLANSRADGVTVGQLSQLLGHPLDVVAVARGHDLRTWQVARLVLRAGDRVRVRDTREHLKRYEAELGVALHAAGDEERGGAGTDQQVAEVLVTDESLLAGRSVRELRLAENHGLVVIGLRRPGGGTLPVAGMADTALAPGDLLLVQGGSAELEAFRSEAAVLLLDGRVELPRSSRALLALAIMAGVVALAAFKLLPIVVSALAGVLAMLATRCLDWRDVGRALSGKVVLMIVASLALGSALTATGGADEMARGFLALTLGADPEIALALLMLLVAALTNFVSNTAAAAVGTPIAVMVANQLGVAPEAFVLAVLFGANLSYATPMGYQTNLLVMGAAGYRFSDFVRGGLPLLVLIWALLAWQLPLWFPLRPV